ncbi:ComEC/Rec2 family competence protein [Dermatobacter hominis]|uniref:ComEC/Rec2 family competence protein n=1 Tax=Dermatobacter hominis TaxID=2884263 RepID=UPI001D0F8C73|nr:ComEC/Rec2 family competence protein [Dermatobacter hominis]UDY35769.1 ComEC/Rec2 family competence protein [Dermatobacter hominis]
MSDAALVATAVLVALCAVLGVAVPVPVLVAVVVLALVHRHPVEVALALALVAGGRSDASLRALEAPLPDRVEGTAQLVGDPEPGRFGTTVELRIGGRRWQAQVGRSDEWVLRPLLTGDHVVVAGRPSAFHGAPVGWQRSRHLAGRLVVTRISRGPPAAPWYRLANGVHRLVADGASSFEPSARSLYLGLVLGDDRAQGDLDRFRFQATGLGHLLAVSGQNVAFVLLLARPVMARCGLRTRWLVGLAVLALFVLLTRAEASVLRAAAMASVALLAATSGRLVSGARVLALAVVGLLLADPLLVTGLGFQLSVCATVGLLVGVRPLSERLPGPRWLADALACTIAAQLATAPLLLGLNGGVPSVATVTNVLAVPVAGAVMVLGLTVGVVAGGLVAPVASVLQWPSRLLVGWVEAVAATGSRSPLPLLGPTRLALLVGAGAALLLRRGRRWPVAVAVALVAVAVRPVPPPVGPTVVGPGVTVCGATVVLDGAVDVVDALEALQRAGVVRAEVVVGPPSESSVHVAEQLDATLQAPTGRAGGDRSDAGSGRSAGPAAASEAPCTVAP